ncbi:Cyclic-di-AMP phosphodiesterase PgpH [bacterium HR27]|nr:Cyclic-di-AMP phosphodiesterase PgpH [bacterium HR27]
MLSLLRRRRDSFTAISLPPDQRARAWLLWLGVIVLLWLPIAVLVYGVWEASGVTLRPGQIADRTIKAPYTATFESQLLTQQARQEAYDDARNIVFVRDPSVEAAQLDALNRLLSQIEAIRSQRGTDLQAATQQAQAALEGLSAEDAQLLVSLSDASWGRIEGEARRLLSAVLAEDVRSDNVAQIKEQLPDRVSLELTAVERRLVVALVRPFIRPNVRIDEEATRAAREAAAQAVPPVMVTVQEGQAIVRDGDPVTPEALEKLEYFGLLSPRESWPEFLGLLALLALWSAAFVVALYRSMQHTRQSRQLLLIVSLVVLTVLAGRLVIVIPELRYAFPVAGTVMLLAVLLDFRTATLASWFLALALGILDDFSLLTALVAGFAGLAGAAVVWRAERTMTFLWGGAAVAVTTAATSLAGLFALGETVVDLPLAGMVLVQSGINGVLSSSLCFLSFSLLGRLLGITTHLQLLELAHPTQPLLARLAREAPGTYHHSLVVGNLAEAAAEAVGADPLLTRVAVLYHDIGKVLHPELYVENQANRVNVHDVLDPVTSARLIKEHVTEGVKLAKRARLPKPIVDIIQQHHGTTLIKYFYAQAKEMGLPVEEAEFRYPGPRPQSKEAAIVMLADSVEAAVRAAAQAGKLYDPNDPHATSRRLAEIVDRVIRERLEDGQLDESDLTLRQISEIRQVFLSLLEGVYHPRVEYPEVAREPVVTPIDERAAAEA